MRSAAFDPLLVVEGERGFSYRLDLSTAREQPDAGMFLVSSPSNPAGRCLSAEERSSLVDIAQALDVPLMIDHAYGNPFPGITEAPTVPVGTTT